MTLVSLLARARDEFKNSGAVSEATRQLLAEHGVTAAALESYLFTVSESEYAQSSRTE